MGIHREGGYSATVEGFLLVGDSRFRLAKTNHEKFILSEPCELPPGTEAAFEIIVDGDVDTTRITLPDGIVLGQGYVRYENNLVPF